MGTLNSHRVPFLNSDWIIDTSNAISANHFSAKANEMFLKCLLYQSSNFNHLWCNGFLSFNKLLLCYLFSFYLHVWSSPTHRITPHHLTWKFDVEICRENLPQEFAEAISRGFFVFVSKASFVSESRSCSYESKPFFVCEQIFFICEIFFINIVSFCYCSDSYGPPYKWDF